MAEGTVGVGPVTTGATVGVGVGTGVSTGVGVGTSVSTGVRVGTETGVANRIVVGIAVATTVLEGVIVAGEGWISSSIGSQPKVNAAIRVNARIIPMLRGMWPIILSAVDGSSTRDIK